MDKQLLIDNLKKNIPSPVLYGTLNYQGNDITFNDFIDNVISKATDLPNTVEELMGKLQSIIQVVKVKDDTLTQLNTIINSNLDYNVKIALNDGEELSYAEVLLDKYNKGLIDTDLNITVGDQKKSIEEFYKVFINNKKITFADMQKKVQDAIDKALSNENDYNKNKILDFVISESTNDTLRDFLLNDIALCIEGDEVFFGDEHTSVDRFVSDAVNGVRMKLYNNITDNVAAVDLIVPEINTKVDDAGLLEIPEKDTHLNDVLNEYNRLLLSFRTISSQIQLDDINSYHEYLVSEIENTPVFVANSLIYQLEEKYKREYEEASKRVMKIKFSTKELNDSLQYTKKDLVEEYKNSNDKMSFSKTVKSQFDIYTKCGKIDFGNRQTSEYFEKLNDFANYQVSLLKEERRDVSMNQDMTNRKEKGKVVFLNKFKKLKKSISSDELIRKAEAFEKAKGENEITREVIEEQSLRLAA